MCILFIMQLRETSFFFFFNDTATTEIYTLSLHDALPILLNALGAAALALLIVDPNALYGASFQDRKSTRLNSSHDQISYAVFCLKKKNNRFTYRFIADYETTNRLFRTFAVYCCSTHITTI